MGKSYVGDIGTRIRTTTLLDMSSVSGVFYDVTKPDSIEYQWTCSIENVTSGIVYYDIVSGDFDQSGRYAYQTDITMTNGDRWRSETRYFDVYEEYK